MFYSRRRHLWASTTRRLISQLWESPKLSQKFTSLLSSGVSTRNISTAKKPGKLQDVSGTNQPSTPRIADIVMGIEDCGVTIERGQLEITSSERSRRGHRTALVLSGASLSLTHYDFRRMLKSKDYSLKGLEEVLPIRDRQTLQRSDSWLLIFTSPAYAVEYQQRVIELQELYLRQVAPTTTTTLDRPTEASTNGRVKHGEHFNYALGSTLRNVSVAAQLFPFDFKLQRTIGIHRGLRQPGSSGNKLFPVKLQLNYVSFPSLDSHHIRKLLKLDGIMRGRRWALPETDDAVIQIEPTTVLGLSQINLEGTGSLSQSTFNFMRMWRVNFLTSFEAARFARVWHQKPLPKLGNEDLHVPSPHVKAECIFR
ncbi:hypothetical protein BDV38DRAFT_181708 [Aspergillus pseudotamarii]|uniref:Uncharacterized protein n=1 Tax=Aspergillus pseudotamarii TaxID=132259 RepID=A0A5N6SGI6_ASPPS|nr:uncharacterized protein BDV38DRAFT_181708 [Aspergillus pseudotamarii]KAE8133782.1 hypothetical protein BDV38DRAFT_181708 [Aspergillus pseudotamarii]